MIFPGPRSAKPSPPVASWRPWWTSRGPRGPGRQGRRRIENGGRTRFVLRNLEDFHGDLVGLYGDVIGISWDFMVI